MDYESKIIVIEQALALVKSGDVIVTGLGASEAGVFMSQLHTVAARGVRDVMVTNCLPTHEFSRIFTSGLRQCRINMAMYPCLYRIHMRCE